MMTSTKLALVATLIGGISIVAIDGAAAATQHRRGAANHALRSAPVQLSQPQVFAPTFAPATRGRTFSGPFRTDSAPITGGGY